jgi:hypothetical protein
MMQLPGFRSATVQPFLFPEELRGHGHVRTVLGKLAEDLTAHFFNGRRYKTDVRCTYCPDVSADGKFYESKACGRSKTTFIYAGRLQKDRDFVLAGNELFYVIWHHTANTKDARTVAELRVLALQSLQAVYVVPFAVVDGLCLAVPEEPLNSAYGHNRDQPVTYGSGFRIHLNLLADYVQPAWPVDLLRGICDVV